MNDLPVMSVSVGEKECCSWTFLMDWKEVFLDGDDLDGVPIDDPSCSDSRHHFVIHVAFLFFC